MPEYLRRKDCTLHCGGLMRCCEVSFSKWVAEHPDAEVRVGDDVPCTYERDQPTGKPIPTMRVTESGVVRWRYA